MDHPLDPANEFLSHSLVGSSDMKNIYDGIATLDADGKAEIEFPNWFDKVNEDFRYQLTAIGSTGQNLYVEEEIRKNKFKIAGGKSGMKVSWQVTGIRKDPWAKSNRIMVEEKKPSKERGYYLTPEIYNKSPNKNIQWVRYQEQKQRLKEIKDVEKDMRKRIRIEEQRVKDMRKKMKRIKDMRKK